MKPLSLSPDCAERSLIDFFRPSVVCSLNWVTRMKATSSPSSRERTERTWMRARVIAISTGLSPALAHDLELDLRALRPAHLLDRLVEGEALHRLVVEMGYDVVGHHAGFGRRGLVDRRHDLIRPSSMVTSMPRPPNSPRVCTCMSRKLLESM